MLTEGSNSKIKIQKNCVLHIKGQQSYWWKPQPQNLTDIFPHLCENRNLKKLNRLFKVVTGDDDSLHHPLLVLILISQVIINTRSSKE